VLSRLPDAEVERLLTGSLERFSAQTITDREALTTELREVRERGWAIADQSWRAGVGAVAAAVVGALGRPVGALAISVPQQRFGPGRESELGPVAVAAAERVSAALR
jgi:DNA-binding IclR family transcriptional regulator